MSKRQRTIVAILAAAFTGSFLGWLHAPFWVVAIVVGIVSAVATPWVMIPRDGESHHA